jgi:hypothetical protein
MYPKMYPFFLPRPAHAEQQPQYRRGTMAVLFGVGLFLIGLGALGYNNLLGSASLWDVVAWISGGTGSWLCWRELERKSIRSSMLIAVPCILFFTVITLVL